MTSKASAVVEGRNWVAILLGILAIGSIWGVSEVAVGTGLRAVRFPYTGGLLTGIAAAVIGITLAVYRKPLLPIVLALIAISYKLLAVPILNIPLMCKANSCLAVGLDGLAFSAMAALMMKQIGKSPYAAMGVGASGALLAATGFFFLGMEVAPCRYLLSFRGNPVGFLIKEGLVWALFSASLLPVGFLAGTRLQPMVAHMLAIRPRLSYAIGISIVASCLAVAIAAILAGA